MLGRRSFSVCAPRIAALALLLCASAPALAQAPSKDPIAVTYESGRSARVRVVALEGERVRVESLILGGSITVTKNLSDFAPGSRLRLVESASPTGTFEAHFALAQRAAGWRLLEQAGRHAQLALATLAGREDAAARETELRAWAADALEAAVRRSIGAGELAYAQHCLKLLTTRVPEQRSEAALAELTTLVDELDSQLRAIRTAARLARATGAQDKELARQLEPIRERLALGDRRLHEAISSSAQTVKSARLAQAAIDAYRAAWSSVQALAERAPNDAVLAEEAAEIGENAQERIVRAALHAANALTVQSDYRAALKWTEEVLAIEPEHREALDMRRTIQIAAAAAGNVWGWGWVFPPGGPPSGPGNGPTLGK
jgi:tetratricopeptide (TPR) repeat protein